MASYSKDTVQQENEVFISSSEDTSRNFTSHLSAEMKRLGIVVIDNRYFICSDENESTTLIREAKEAIGESEIFVIVLSKQISAKSCVELTHAMKYRKTIAPVFYGVDPSDVRNQTGTYYEIFDKFEKNYGENKVKEWRNALSHATNYAGWNCNVKRSDFQIVEEIAMDVVQILNRVKVSDINRKIAKYEELGKLQYQSYMAQLKMERSLRLLRLSPHLLSYI